MKAEITNIINSTENYEEIFAGIHATVSQVVYHTVEGTPLSKIHQTLARNEPDNKKNKESCLTLNSNEHLADVSCGKTRPYICYRSVDSKQRVNQCGTTDPEYRLDARTNSCYKFHTVIRNFSRAFLTCSAEGGHLAIINSDTEATVLKELYAKYPDSMMVGLEAKDKATIVFYDWGERSEFRTIHGQTLTEAGYSKFAPGQPDNAAPEESCGSMLRSGLLNDFHCDVPVPFICEKNPDYPAICHAEIRN